MTADEKRVGSLLDEDPNERSYDDLLRAMAFARMIEHGLADSEMGRVVDCDIVAQQIDSWAR